jgi:hypothetical protein
VPALVAAVLEPLGVGVEGAPLRLRVPGREEQSEGGENRDRAHGGRGEEMPLRHLELAKG